MIALIALALALDVGAGGVPPVLQGTDHMPTVEAVAAASVEDLVAVVQSDRHRPLHRARAARLLGGRRVDDVAIDAVLKQARRETRGPLAGQLTLALGDRARARGDRDVVVTIADAAIADADVDVARAGVLLWWRIGGAVGRTRLERLATLHADERVRGACRGRLRAWGRSGGDDGHGTVLDPPHGGPSPAR